MPTPRRRVVSSPVGTTIGSLLADRQAELNQANSAAAAARAETNFKEQQAAKATGALLAQANTAYQSYRDGNITLPDLKNQLNQIKTGATDAELLSQLSAMSASASTIAQSRMISAEVQKFNDGAINYDQLKASIGGQDRGNAVLQSNIAKNLADARVAENTRQMNTLLGKYQTDGNSQAYLDGLQQLRGQQTTPAELQKINSAIESGKQMATSLNYEKTMAQWQSGQIGSAAAMAYFNSEVANAKDPMVAQMADKFLQTISASASSSAKAALSHLSAQETELIKSYETDTFRPALEAAQKNGDQAAIHAAVDAFSHFMAGDPQTGAKGISSLGSPTALLWQQRAVGLQAGANAAASAALFGVNGAIMNKYKDNRAEIIKQTNLTPAEKAVQLSANARLLANGANGLDMSGRPAMNPPTQQQAMLLDSTRNTEAGIIRGLVIEQAKLNTSAIGSKGSDAQALWDGIHLHLDALPADSPIKAFLGQPDAQSKFTDWLSQSPQNLQSALDAAKIVVSKTGVTTIPGEGTVQAGKSFDDMFKSIIDSKAAGDLLNQASAAYYKTVYPWASDADIKQFVIAQNNQGATGTGEDKSNPTDLSGMSYADRVAQAYFTGRSAPNAATAQADQAETYRLQRQGPGVLPGLQLHSDETGQLVYQQSPDAASRNQNPPYVPGPDQNKSDYNANPPQTLTSQFLSDWAKNSHLDEITSELGKFFTTPGGQDGQYTYPWQSGVAQGIAGGVGKFMEGGVIGGSSGQFWTPMSDYRKQQQNTVTPQSPEIPQFDLSKYLQNSTVTPPGDALAGGDVQSTPPQWNWNYSPETVSTQQPQQAV